MLCLVAATTLFAFTHEYYVSICTIDYNEANKSLELTFKLTAHDLEKSILQNQKIDLKLGSDKEYEKADEVLKEYIRNHFNLSHNGTAVKLNYIGKEVELDESLYIYFEATGVKELGSFRISNTILIESFPGQENLLYFNAQKRVNEVFNKDITSKEIKL